MSETFTLDILAVAGHLPGVHARFARIETLIQNEGSDGAGEGPRGYPTCPATWARAESPRASRQMLDRTSAMSKSRCITPNRGEAKRSSFYRIYPHLGSHIRSSTPLAPDQILRLSWTHLIELLRLDDPWKRAFYENECLEWNMRYRRAGREYMTPIPLLGCRIHKATDGKIDWSLTAWEVSRRAQLRRSRGLTLREGSAGVEGMADVARRFGKTRRTAGAGGRGLEIEPMERAELAREEDVDDKPSKVHP